MEVWQKQFVRKLFHYSARHMDIDGAFRIKHLYVPSKLYKYRHFSDNHIGALIGGKLWSSSPDRLNDPYEVEFTFDSDRFYVEDISATEFIQKMKRIEADIKAGGRLEMSAHTRKIKSGEWIEREARQLLSALNLPDKEDFLAVLQEFLKAQKNNEVERTTNLLRQGLSVLSLSATPESELLWSHYSNSHKGFAIEYNFADLSPDHPRKRLCFPVFYTKKPRDATFYMARGDFSNFNNLYAQYMLLMKHSQWAYEQEWRIIHSIGPSHANIELDMPKPSAVIFGLKSELDGASEQKVIDFCKREGIAMKRATHTPGRFGLSIKDHEI